MVHLDVGIDELLLRGETLEDQGHDGRFDRTPGSSRIGVISQDLQTLWRRFRARITVKRLCS